MNIQGHFETITRHKMLVMRYCFECGLYAQGLAHDLSKYSRRSLSPAASITRGTTAPMKQNVRPGGIPRLGCIIRGAISITWNIGSITAIPSRAWWG